MSAISIRSLQAMKQQEKFSMLTAYDATFAQQAADAGVEVLLVGDSLGNVIQGHDSTLPVTVADMAYHTANVARGNRRAQRPALIMTDLPFMSHGTVEQGLESARLVMQAGAHILKLRSEEHTSELQSRPHLVCRLLLEKKKRHTSSDDSRAL